MNHIKMMEGKLLLLLLHLCCLLAVSGEEAAPYFERVKHFWQNCVFPDSSTYTTPSGSLIACERYLNTGGRGNEVFVCSQLVSMTLKYCNKTTHFYDTSAALLQNDKIQGALSTNPTFQSPAATCNFLNSLNAPLKQNAVVLSDVTKCQSVCSNVNFFPVCKLIASAQCLLSNNRECLLSSRAELPKIPPLAGKEAEKVEQPPVSAGSGQNDPSLTNPLTGGNPPPTQPEGSNAPTSVANTLRPTANLTITVPPANRTNDAKPEGEGEKKVLINETSVFPKNSTQAPTTTTTKSSVATTPAATIPAVTEAPAKNNTPPSNISRNATTQAVGSNLSPTVKPDSMPQNSTIASPTFKAGTNGKDEEEKSQESNTDIITGPGEGDDGNERSEEYGDRNDEFEPSEDIKPFIAPTTLLPEREEFDPVGKEDPSKTDDIEIVKPLNGNQQSQPANRPKDSSKLLREPGVGAEAPGSGHFFAYFLTAVVICISGYVIFHNKQKIIAFVVEGRKGEMEVVGNLSGGPKYSQLISNVEEVMPSLENAATSKNFVY